MATLVQEIARGSQAAALTHTFAVPAAGVAAGHHIVIVMYSRQGGTAFTLSSVTDARGNTYQIDTQSNSTSQHVAIVSCLVTVALLSGDLITATYSGSVGQWDGIAMEWSGLAATSWLDGTPNSTIASGNSPTAAITTTNADDLLIAVFGDLIATTFTPGTGFTQEGATLNGAGPTHLNVEYEEVLSAGSYQGTATWTVNPGANGARAFAAYKAVAAGPVVTAPTVVTRQAVQRASNW